MLLAVREELVFRRLIEHVVDHLDAVDEPGVERAKHVGRFPPVHADAEGANQALALQVIDGALPAFVRDLRVVPDVELLEVHGFQAEVLQTLFLSLIHI